MANNLNRVTISGRLTKDVTLKQTRSETYVACFDIACHYYAGSADPNAVAFIPVRAMGKTAEFIGKYFRKGDEIYVDGTLKEDRWEKDGQNRSLLYVMTDNVFFGPRKKGSGDGALPEQPAQEQDSSEFAEIKVDGDLPF